MSGWLAGSRVRHIVTGATGTVLGIDGALFVRPWVAWDDGSQTRVWSSQLSRAADDWLSRAVEGTP